MILKYTDGTSLDFPIDTLVNPPHLEVFNTGARFKVAACGRRFGKTYLSAYVLLHAAYTTKGNYYYISPTLQQSHDIFWNILKEKAVSGMVKKINESRHTIEFVTGSVIALKGSDRPDTMRGISLSGVVLDEVATFRYFEDTWQRVIRPALSDQQGFALFISSPSGRNHFYDLYNNAKTKDDWHSWQFRTIDGGYVPQSELDAALHDLDERSFRQEYLGTFESFSGLIVPHFERVTHFEKDFELHPHEPLHIGIDLNVSIMPASVCVIRRGVVIAFDEFFGALDTPELIGLIQDRYPDKDIIIYPDNSSGARKSVGADVTDVKLFQKAFGNVKKKNANPRIQDRINAFNVMVKAGDGTVRFKVTPNCKRLIEALEKHAYDPNTNLPDKKAGYDHMFDAISYLTLWHSPLTKTITTVTAGVR